MQESIVIQTEEQKQTKKKKKKLVIDVSTTQKQLFPVDNNT